MREENKTPEQNLAFAIKVMERTAELVERMADSLEWMEYTSISKHLSPEESKKVIAQFRKRWGFKENE